METINVKFDRNDVIDNYNYENGKVFYLGYENEPSKQVSVMFSNWDWVRKHFGDNFERLNDGRKNEIANLQKCIEWNVPMWELTTIVSFEYGIYKRIALGSHGNNLQVFDNEKKEMVDKIIEHKPYKLSEGGKKQFENNIAKGHLVLCRLV